MRGDLVEQQAKKGVSECHLERIVAFMSLIMMMFDASKSDCLYKILTKLKSLTHTITEEVRHQSLDEWQSIDLEKRLTIDFEVESDEVHLSKFKDHTFAHWWENQLARNNTLPHYRTEGYFMEFTRETAASVAAEIAHNKARDILLRGAVGSGKSTGLPFHLSKKGKVLLLEPTRPLAENVCKQLRGEPFHVSATLRMRGLSSFGSAPIHVMTSGYALHFLVNNVSQLNDFDFIIFDECHVLDASAMAFRCALEEFGFPGKIIKVSATPPGREVEFKTQYPVQVLQEESLSFEAFVQAQGTGSNADMISKGDNILVYVASYNEVDQLSKRLIERKFEVTKVDGRTMKMGSVEIETHGTPERKHFIVATNIIENGVTLDIDVVVDFGLKVVPQLDPEFRCVNYKKVNISFGERIQRLGRVGRHKRGTALRINWTEKGLSEIPPIIATEAAFLSFCYGLPVMTNNVSTSILANCTVTQARTMQNFELSPFYTVNLVRFDGSMHPVIHNILKQFKLRDSEIQLTTLAIPHHDVPKWVTAQELKKYGVHTNLDDGIRIPFYIKDIPDRVHQQIWEAVVHHKKDAGFARMTSASAAKIAYTLQTDLYSIPRTLAIIDKLLQHEVQKQASFKAMSAHAGSGFSIMSVINSVRMNYMSDHTGENIEKLQRARDQILEYKNLNSDVCAVELLQSYNSLECVRHQNAAEISKHLQLRGIWNKGQMSRDVLLAGFTLVGGLWMVGTWYYNKSSEVVRHQGMGKRQAQKLRFRNARDGKLGREVYGDDGTMEHYFGEAYTKKAKKSGKTHGMGKKQRQFINFYGCNPDDFSLIRYVDPLTGFTIDADPTKPVHKIQNEFHDIRWKLVLDDEMNSQKLYTNEAGTLKAYLIRKNTANVLEADLTMHVPTLVCKSGVISGFPEREGEARQTGPLRQAKLPDKNEYEVVQHEGKSICKGLRDYNPISSIICKLTNCSGDQSQTLYGLGYGSYIVTVQHLFRINNGTLKVQSRHGEFVCKNTTQLKMYPCEGRDVLIIQMPKDFPPFPKKLQFRKPVNGETVVLVGSNFQQKSFSSTVSEPSVISPRENCHFWKHYISTKDGDCGCPLVAISDGSIVGVHSMEAIQCTHNYFTDFPIDIKAEILDNGDSVEWSKNWSYNVNNICFGQMKLMNDAPMGMFHPTKLISDLYAESVRVQGHHENWLYNSLDGNLKALAKTSSQLVTKHVVKGKCALFETYLSLNPEAEKLFRPFMSAYGKSALNKAAYIKDFMKYSTPILVGEVDTGCFEKATCAVENMMRGLGFIECEYVTDEQTIFGALNMKAAVGALYSGKKQEYFADYTQEDKCQILEESCMRLYTGRMGVWNGALKAELRPIEKVEANKTRSFTAAPIDTLLAGKVCVDDFNNQFYSMNIKGPWSVGMTKFYGGWDKLLTSFPSGWIYCDADGSQFDSSLSPYLINAVLNLRISFMEKWDIGEQMLKNLYTEIVYTPIATPDGTIVKKFKGNNSGQPSTVVDNTLMVILAMYYSAYKFGWSVEELEANCKFFVNGDDLIIGIEPSSEKFLDGLAESFAQLGLKYDFTSRTRTITELWFMSHKGIEREGMLIPKLEEERIVSILEWDRAVEPEHRLEAICAAMVEAWGYDWLLYEIRKFYSWVLAQFPYSELAKSGKAPYIAETALRKLYLDCDATVEEIQSYTDLFEYPQFEEEEVVRQQSGAGEEETSFDAGKTPPPKTKDKAENSDQSKQMANRNMDQDVNVGTSGSVKVPRLKSITSKMKMPKVRGKIVLNLEHLIQYNPEQEDLSNTRATQAQFQAWYDGVKNDYDVSDEEMEIILNGLVVWCIENGTSPNITGMWVMMDGEEQIEYPIKPLIDHAKPTLRQIMAHFSDVAEAYIEKRNMEKAYMPRYGLQRNLNDRSLARYAFDFYEVTSRTPNRAREAHLQMKAAALGRTTSRMFGLDGNVGQQEENTERHTVDDVNPNMHNLLGVRNM